MGNWSFCEILNYRWPAINPTHYFIFFGLVHASDKCSNKVMKHDNLVQHYMILLYDIIILLIVCLCYNQMIMHFLWFPTCIFILVLFRIQQHIAEPYFKIVSRTAQLRRLQVSLVRFQYVSRDIHAIFLLKLKVTSFFTPNINLSKLLQYCNTLCLFIATVYVNI